MNSEEIIAAQQKMIDQLAAMLQWYVDEDQALALMNGVYFN